MQKCSCGKAQKCGGNISKAARSLGVSRTTLYRVLSKNNNENQ
ncbi:helix-turn-helix domain-containing protein [Pseudomonas rustica]